MISQIVVLFLMLATLTACSGGGGQGSASLEVTRAFATGNASFEGGLYIHGKKSDGEEFSFALPATQKASITLSFGSWVIRAVGWDDGDPGEVFTGKTLCAIEEVNFSSNNQTLSLHVTEDKCNNIAFANNTGGDSTNYFVSGTSNFKSLDINFCGALYDPTDVNLLRDPSDNLALDFCALYPKIYQQKPKSLKISLQNKLPGKAATDGLTTLCLPVVGPPITFTTGMLFPAKIPLVITVYEKPGCVANQVAGVYNFPLGLDHGQSRAQAGFDSLIYPDGYSTSAIILALASPMSKRGTTPFITETPRLECDNGNNGGADNKCLRLPDLSGLGKHYLFEISGSNTIRIPGVNLDCTNTGFVSTTDGSNPYFSLVPGSCKLDGADTLVEIKTNPINAIEELAASFDIGDPIPTTYNVIIKSEQKRILKDLKRHVSYSSSAGDVLNSLEDKSDHDEGHEQDKSAGAFSDMANMLSPSILGGFFWEQSCTNTPLASPIKHSATFWEKGVEKNYQVIMTNPPAVNAPRYIVNNDPQTLINSNPFHRRIILREFKNAALGYKTDMVLDIACDGVDVINMAFPNDNLRIGRVEEIHLEDEGTKYRDEHRVMYWNTTLFENSRFERYETDTETLKADGSVQSRRSSYVRGEKSSAGTSDLKITDMSYEYKLDMGPGTGPQESFMHTETDINEVEINSTKLGSYTLKKQFNQTLTPGTIFNDGLDVELKNRIRYNISRSPNERTNGLQVRSNGKYLHAYARGTKLYVDYFNGSSPVAPLNDSATPDLVATDLSFDGVKAIVAYTDSGNSVQFKIYNGSTWTDSSATIPSYPLTNLKAKILDNGEYMFAGTNSLNKPVYAIGQADGTTPSAMTAVGATTTNDTTPEIAIVKDPDEFYFILNIFNSVSDVRDTAYCAMKLSAPNCNSVSTIVTSTGSVDIINNLSAYNSANGDQITVSLKHRIGTPSTYKTFSSPTSSIVWTPTSYPSPIFDTSIMWISNKSFTMDNLDTGASVYLNIPYAPPGAPNFNMNYMSLNPANMISPSGSPTSKVFTHPDTFQNIGGGL